VALENQPFKRGAIYMKLKRVVLLFAVMGFVTASVYAQSKPRAGNYKYETGSVLHWVSIDDEGDDRYTVRIVSTNSGLKDGIRITGAYWRPGSGAIEFQYNGRTVQIRAESGGRSISCSLFGSVILRKE
jgi:hypothetical protein